MLKIRSTYLTIEPGRRVIVWVRHPTSPEQTGRATPLTVTTIAQSTVSNTDAFINAAPDDDDYIQLDIDVLLTPGP